MDQTKKPNHIILFDNLLWVNSPKHWRIKTTYYNGTLFVSIIIRGVKISRTFNCENIKKRYDDVYGMASDCIDEIRRNRC